MSYPVGQCVSAITARSPAKPGEYGVIAAVSQDEPIVEIIFDVDETRAWLDVKFVAVASPTKCAEPIAARCPDVAAFIVGRGTALKPSM